MPVIILAFYDIFWYLNQVQLKVKFFVQYTMIATQKFSIIIFIDIYYQNTSETFCVVSRAISPVLSASENG